jgi:hypothetical protein
LEENVSSRSDLRSHFDIFCDDNQLLVSIQKMYNIEERKHGYDRKRGTSFRNGK